MLRDVLIQTAGHELLHAEAKLAFLLVESEHLRLHNLPNLEHVARMIDALFSTNLADVNHSLDAFSNLHEGSKVHDAGDWSLCSCSRNESLRRIRPLVAERLFQTERDAPLCRVYAENYSLDTVTRLHNVA